MSPERDLHHIAHDRLSWHARPESLAIRENPSLLARNMGRTAHNLLHKMTSAVPVPNLHQLQYIVNRLPTDLAVLEGIDEYSRLVEASLKHPKVRYIERKLGELSIEAMRAQIPYLKEFINERE